MAIYKNTPPIVTNGLVTHLDAGSRLSYVSGSTVWNDLSGNRNSGSLVNGPAFSTNNQGVIVTDGTNDTITTTIPTIGSTYSISFWIRPVTLPAGVGSEIQLFGSPGDVASISFFAAVSNVYKFISWNGSTGRTGTTTVVVGSWYNFVMVNSTNTVFYLNGIIDGTFASTATLNSGAATFASIGGARFLNANFSSIMFHNRALSAQEVNQNYNALKARFGLT